MGETEQESPGFRNTSAFIHVGEMKETVTTPDEPETPADLAVPQEGGEQETEENKL